MPSTINRPTYQAQNFGLPQHLEDPIANFVEFLLTGWTSSGGGGTATLGGFGGVQSLSATETQLGSLLLPANTFSVAGSSVTIQELLSPAGTVTSAAKTGRWKIDSTLMLNQAITNFALAGTLNLVCEVPGASGTIQVSGHINGAPVTLATLTSFNTTIDHTLALYSVGTGTEGVKANYAFATQG
jgi:hypothetical protein